MPASKLGSLTKEPPLATLDATLKLVRPGMKYDQLRKLASKQTHGDAPGLVRKRFLSIDPSGGIQYDGLLSLIHAFGAESPRVRKVMYFVWAWRDYRVGNFILQKVADAKGRWRVNQLLDKTNATFFEQFMTSDSAKKARSNLEFFLAEAGIVDVAKGTVRLDPSDGWLIDAMAILAQEESDPGRRVAMLTNPIDFLFREGKNGLANLPVDSPLNYGHGQLDTIEWLDDARIKVEVEGKQLIGKEWKPRELNFAGTGTKNVEVDLVALERATKSHHLLEKIATDAIKARGCVPKFTANIDVYYQPPGEAVLMEMKSCRAQNLHSQVRRGVSQLLEYRFLHTSDFGHSPRLSLVLETAPTSGKQWLTDYLVEVGIVPAWKHPSEDALITTAPIPDELGGVIHPA